MRAVTLIHTIFTRHADAIFILITNIGHIGQQRAVFA